MNETTLAIFEMLIDSLILPLILYGVVFLRSKTRNEKLQTAIDMAGKAVEAAVSETSQVFVDEMKRLGKFDEDAAKEAAQLAFIRSKEILGGEAEKLLKHSMVNINEFLMAKIEEEVRRQKPVMTIVQAKTPDQVVNPD